MTLGPLHWVLLVQIIMLMIWAGVCANVVVRTYWQQKLEMETKLYLTKLQEEQIKKHFHDHPGHLVVAGLRKEKDK